MDVEKENVLDAQKEQTMTFNIQIIFNQNIHNKNKIEVNFTDKEMLIAELPISKNNIPNNDDMGDLSIKINDLIQCLKHKGYPIFSKSKLYLYLKICGDYAFIDDSNGVIFLSMLPENNLIQLKVNNILESNLIEDTFTIMKNYFLEKDGKQNKEKSMDLGEKKIGDIIKVVYLYRNLFEGFTNDKGKFIHYKLEKAANIVGLNQKTLDYYFLIIKKARKKNFNFNKNKNESFSKLKQEE